MSLVLPLTSAGQRSLIESALYGLHPDGSTNAEAGLRMGYEVAGAGLTAGANNRVVLLSDGVANVGNTGVDAMLAGVAEQRARRGREWCADFPHGSFAAFFQLHPQPPPPNPCPPLEASLLK